MEPVDTSNVDRLMYSPPETLLPTTPLGLVSNPAPHPQVHVSPAADMWAVGVIAYELLTNERIFAPDTSAREILSAILGANYGAVNENTATSSSKGTMSDTTRTTSTSATSRGAAGGVSVRGGLPWEAHVRGSEERNARLRGLRGLVLACLERDETKRPTSEQLIAALEHAFDSMFTQGTFATRGRDATRAHTRTRTVGGSNATITSVNAT